MSVLMLTVGKPLMLTVGKPLEKLGLAITRKQTLLLL